MDETLSGGRRRRRRGSRTRSRRRSSRRREAPWSPGQRRAKRFRLRRGNLQRFVAAIRGARSASPVRMRQLSRSARAAAPAPAQPRVVASVPRGARSIVSRSFRGEAGKAFSPRRAGRPPPVALPTVLEQGVLSSEYRTPPKNVSGAATAPPTPARVRGGFTSSPQ